MSFDHSLLEAGKVGVPAQYVGWCCLECADGWRWGGKRRGGLHVRKATLRDHRHGAFRRRKGWRRPGWLASQFLPYARA